MSRYRIKPNTTQRGFSLLLAALMSVIVLMVGMTILNTSFKQVTLTEIATDSERAFHAAYAGVECAQFWNVDNVWDVGGGDQSIECMEQAVTTDQSPSLTDNADEITEVEIDWRLAASAGGEDSFNQCTKLTVYKYYSPSATTQMTILPDFTSGFNRTCAIGVECTVVVSKGYSRACDRLGSVRTVEREVIVRF